MKQEMATQKRLPWNIVYKKFINLIKFSTKSVNKIDILMESSDIFQEGQLILYKCWIKYGDKSMEEFTKIFKASLWNSIRSLNCKKIVHTTDLESLIQINEEPAYEEQGFNLDIFEDREKLEKLVKLLRNEPVALTILREFMYPTERTLWEMRMDTYRRETLRKCFNIHLKVAKRMSPTKKTIMRAMEVPPEVFQEGFLKLKQALKKIYFDQIRS